MAVNVYVLYTVLIGAFVAALCVRRRLGRSEASLGGIRGPPPSSWLAGNLPFFVRAENLGDADTELVEKYGLAFKLKGTFNVDMLYLADPQAIQHVFNTCGYTFHKKNMSFLFHLITGPSLLAVEGEDHARQRKTLLPAFSHGVIKEFVPAFMQVAQKAAGKWRDIVQEAPQASSVIDMCGWLSRLTLDAIGQAAFSFDFGAMDDTDNEFLKAYRNVFVDMFRKPSDAQLAVGVIFKYIPLWFIPLLRRLPQRGMKRLVHCQDIAKKITSNIVQSEMQALDGGSSHGKNVMSRLVQANLSESSKSRMSDEELLSQMTGLMIAGHDTTSGSMVWLLYELSRHPEVQVKLREEVRATRAATGHGEIGVTDFESMTYTTAVIKETLRFYPIAAHNARTAGRDEVIPLSKPVETVSGEKITQIPVKKNTAVLTSIWAYNRIKSLWGEDAEEWNPDRFIGDRLRERPKNSIGVYANLATFSSGVHSCLGWRFAILQMQAVVVTLVENFEFSPPPGDLKISRASAPTLIPMVQGQEERGVQMPLTITPID